MIQTAIRAASQPVSAPPAISTGNRDSASPRLGLGTPSITNPMNRPKSAIAAASFSRLSPSMIRASLRGADSDRKIDTTADGSVVDTIAPINRQAASGKVLAQDSA